MSVIGIDPLGLGKAYEDCKRILAEAEKEHHLLREDYRNDPSIGKAFKSVGSSLKLAYIGFRYGIPGSHDKVSRWA